MSIKTNYNFKGIEVKDAIIRVDRIWGSSKENWTALVGVYNVTEDTYNKLEEFNHSATYNVDERGYESMYKSLKDKFGGADC